MKQNVYSESKALCHTGRLEAIRSGQQPYPVHVQLIISDWCPQACRFCSYRWDGNTSNELFHVIDQKTGEKNHNPKRMIPFGKTKEILDDCSEMGVKAIQYTGGGEPLAHPNHCDIFKYTSNLGLDWSLVTNGVLLRDRSIDLLASSATWCRVSIDTSNETTYSKVRRVSDEQFHRALRNTRRLCEAKQRHGSDIVIGIGFVVTEDNWSEVVDAAKIAKETGVDSFRISAVFQPDGAEYFSEFYERASDLCIEAESFSDDSFHVANSFGKRLDDLHVGHPKNRTCGYMQFTTYIGGTLQVFRCCNQSYNQNGFIGSIANRRFKELWDSEFKKRDFEKFDARRCDRCQFIKINDVIASAVNSDSLPIIDTQPPHANFV